jgi:hypothetical protein
MGEEMTVGRIKLSAVPPNDPWAALDSIREITTLKPRPANSFTIAEYCERYQINRQTATSQLENLVIRGQLRKQKALVSGKHSNVYWIP